MRNTRSPAVPLWRRKKVFAAVSALGASAVCAAMLIVGSPFASAATTNLLSCTGSGGAKFSSPVTNTAKTETVTPQNSTGNCVDVSNMSPVVTKADILASNPKNTGTVTASCLSESNATATVYVNWTLAGGGTDTSTVTVTKVSGDDTDDTATAQVTAGRFNGAKVTVDGVNTTLADLLDCSGSGFSAASGTLTVVLSQ